MQAMWKKLGIDDDDQAAGVGAVPRVPRPAAEHAVDVYRLGWIGDYVDDINFLELWTCKSGNNNTNFSDPEYDRLVEKATNTPDDDGALRALPAGGGMLTGPKGAMPIAPIYWYTYTSLEGRPSRTASTSTCSTSSTSQGQVIEEPERGRARAPGGSAPPRPAAIPPRRKQGRRDEVRHPPRSSGRSRSSCS